MNLLEITYTTLELFPLIAALILGTVTVGAVLFLLIDSFREHKYKKFNKQKRQKW